MLMVVKPMERETIPKSHLFWGAVSSRFMALGFPQYQPYLRWFQMTIFFRGLRPQTGKMSLEPRIQQSHMLRLRNIDQQLQTQKVTQTVKQKQIYDI